MPAPTGPARRLASGFIAVVLVGELVLPLRYYVAGGGRDERFSWRMFSSVDRARCVLRVTKSGGGPGYATLALPDLLHARWIEDLERGQPRVVDAFLRWACPRTGATAVDYALECRAPSGAGLAPIRRAIDCATGVLDGALRP